MTGRLLETHRVVTLLGLALHDLVSDSRVSDGLVVTARPTAGGRVSTAFATRSGAYGFRGLDGMAALELLDAGEDWPSTTRDFDVVVVDLRGRFLPLVLRVPVPTQGLLTASVAGVAVESVPDDDLPLYLFSAPTRVLPGHVAEVRAEVVDAASGEPAAFARVDVTVHPADPRQRRYSGVTDDRGRLLLPVPYPRFATPLGAASVPPGSRGLPPARQQWPVRLTVHHDPARLDRREGLPAPPLRAILGQRQGSVLVAAGTERSALEADLHYGTPLTVRSPHDGQSRLLVRAPASEA